MDNYKKCFLPFGKFRSGKIKTKISYTPWEISRGANRIIIIFDLTFGKFPEGYILYDKRSFYFLEKVPKGKFLSRKLPFTSREGLFDQPEMFNATRKWFWDYSVGLALPTNSRTRKRCCVRRTDWLSREERVGI